MRYTTNSLIKLSFVIAGLVIFFSHQVFADLTTTVTTSSTTALETQQAIYDNYVNNVLRAQSAAAANLALEQQQAARNAQLGAALQVFFHYCPLTNALPAAKTVMGKKGQDIKEQANDINEIMMKAREQDGYVYEEDIDRETAESVGHDIVENIPGGCKAKFMNDAGQMGPYGSWALTEIKRHPNSFGQNVPDDLTKWCPNYPKMNPGQRELFWVWIMMSMASSESSCNPKADNKKARNGTAMGLFQLEYAVCPNASSERHNIHAPEVNITCAVNLLAKELQNRDTLMTPTSKGKEGTYWGPLRSDDWNKKRGGDIRGAQKTRSVMEKYRYCRGSSTGSGKAEKQSNSK